MYLCNDPSVEEIEKRVIYLFESNQGLNDIIILIDKNIHFSWYRGDSENQYIRTKYENHIEVEKMEVSLPENLIKPQKEIGTL